MDGFQSRAESRHQVVFQRLAVSPCQVGWWGGKRWDELMVGCMKLMAGCTKPMVGSWTDCD